MTASHKDIGGRFKVWFISVFRISNGQVIKGMQETSRNLDNLQPRSRGGQMEASHR